MATVLAEYGYETKDDNGSPARSGRLRPLGGRQPNSAVGPSRLLEGRFLQDRVDFQRPASESGDTHQFEEGGCSPSPRSGHRHLSGAVIFKDDLRFRGRDRGNAMSVGVVKVFGPQGRLVNGKVANMKLLRGLPQGRSVESLENQYLVEKGLADKLKSASREERTQIFATMYDELFSKVPDHSRLKRRRSEELTRRKNDSKMALVRKELGPSIVFLEFGAGDCRFVMEVAGHVKTAFAVDISDQRENNHPVPENFSLVTYNGYSLDAIAEGSVDIVFSDQLIEHLHPDDTADHIKLVHRILRPGGKYIFSTPHAFTGPHDISKYFSYEPQGFHLKEWTYLELRDLLRRHGFNRVQALKSVFGRTVPMPYMCLGLCERAIKLFPKATWRFLARCSLPVPCVAGTK